MLAKASGLSIEELIAHGADLAPATVATVLKSLAARRLQREPMAYIVGEREFWGLPFKVTPAVLVPRPDSETVIEAALSLLTDRNRAWRLLDLGVGSGCLLLTLLKELPEARGIGFEISRDALDVARINASSLGVEGRTALLVGDWRQPDWEDQAEGPCDLVVSNPPYVESAEIPRLMPEVARFEPRQALDGGPDGLAAYRIIAAAGRRLLVPGGHLVVEVGQGQVTEIAAIFASAGLVPLPPWKDLGGVERVVAARH